MCGGVEFAKWKGRLEKVIKFLCDEKTLAVRKGCGGSKFAKGKGRLEKIINFNGDEKT